MRKQGVEAQKAQKGDRLALGCPSTSQWLGGVLEEGYYPP